jgi:hypothetical protein
MGIEPTLAAWEAAVLPLNYTRTERALTGEVRISGAGNGTSPAELGQSPAFQRPPPLESPARPGRTTTLSGKRRPGRHDDPMPSHQAKAPAGCKIPMSER